MRVALARLSAAGLLAAVVWGLPQTWRHLGDASRVRSRDGDLAAARHEDLPVAAFRRWKARLGPHDRWWIAVPAGSVAGLTSRGGVYRAFATYYFLPALPAESERDATIVFHAGRTR